VPLLLPSVAANKPWGTGGVYTGRSSDHRRRLEGKQILVVEDEAQIALAAEDDLLDAGVRVIGPAASVSEALHLIEAALSGRGVDAAVLDVKLGDGLVSPVAGRLTALGVPFVFVTGYGTGCGTDGAHAAAPVLHKPFAPPELIAVPEMLTSDLAHRLSTDERQSNRLPQGASAR